MARSQLDFRKNVNDGDSSSSGFLGAFAGAPPLAGSSILAPMEIASRDSSFRAEGEPVAVLLQRGRPTTAARPSALPGQDVGVPEQDWGNHVSYLWSSPLFQWFERLSCCPDLSPFSYCAELGRRIMMKQNRPSELPPPRLKSKGCPCVLCHAWRRLFLVLSLDSSAGKATASVCSIQSPFFFAIFALATPFSLRSA